MARGSIVLSRDIPVNGDSASISFQTTSQMAPKARLIVYAVRSSNREILVDATDFKVNGLFRNNVYVCSVFFHTISLHYRFHYRSTKIQLNQATVYELL